MAIPSSAECKLKGRETLQSGLTLCDDDNDTDL